MKIWGDFRPKELFPRRKCRKNGPNQEHKKSMDRVSPEPLEKSGLQRGE